jgi:hypothetical protein
MSCNQAYEYPQTDRVIVDGVKVNPDCHDSSRERLSEVLVMARRLIDRPLVEPELGCDLRVMGAEPPEILAGPRRRTTR